MSLLESHRERKQRLEAEHTSARKALEEKRRQVQAALAEEREAAREEKRLVEAARAAAQAVAAEEKKRMEEERKAALEKEKKRMEEERKAALEKKKKQNMDKSTPITRTAVADSPRIRILKSPPTICFAWCQGASMHIPGAFWGLGDTIRGMIAASQLCDRERYNFVVDIHRHPFSEFLDYPRSVLSPIVEKIESIPFYGLGGAPIPNVNEEELLIMFGNSFCREPLLEKEKELVRKVLTIKPQYKLDLPSQYNVFHVRIGDDAIKSGKVEDLHRYYDMIKEYVQPGDVICSDCPSFKIYVKERNPAILIYNQDASASHFGYTTDLCSLRATLDDLQVLTNAQNIYTYSTYPWISNFVYWVGQCYNIPIVSLSNTAQAGIPRAARHMGSSGMDLLNNFLLTSQGPIVWCTLINTGYVDFTRNFLESKRRAGINWNLLVFCSDKGAYDALCNTEGCICIDASNILQNLQLSKNLTTWLTDDYKRITFAKLDVLSFMVSALETHPGKHVGYIDTDIVVFKDPTVDFVEYMETHKEFQIFAQCDHNMKCSNPYWCTLCTGLIVLRNGFSYSKLFIYTEDDIQHFTSDQEFILDKIRKHKIPMRTLPKDVLLNGTYPGVRGPGKLKLPESASLLHFNWMKAAEKIPAMRRVGLWYL